MNERRAKVLADRIAGMTYAQIAGKHGIAHLTARRYCKKAVRLGLATPEQIRTNELFGEVRGPRLSDADKLADIFAKAKKTAGGCWEYPAWKNATGHVHTVHGRTWLVHRLVWTLVKGQIPAGLVVMHKCDNGCCCNPDHLRLGTRAQNNQDMHRKGRSNYSLTRKTHCIRGHEFTPENTIYHGKENFRRCRECNRARMRKGYVPRERQPLTKAQLRQQRYRVRRKARLAAQNVSG